MTDPDDQRAESVVQRADRNMIELLQELRVTQTGVQILFAFLLALSFTDRLSPWATACSGTAWGCSR